MKEQKYCHCGSLRGWVGAILWILGLVAVIIGWWWRSSIIGYGGLDFNGWMWLALVLGVLSVPCSLRGKCPCGGRECGGCGGSGCDVCK